jgi:flagellar basal body-associated protein FliL
MLNQNQGKVKILVIIIIVLVQIIIAGTLYFLFFANKDNKIKPIAKKDAKLESGSESAKSDDSGADNPNLSKEAKDYLKVYSLYNVSDIVINPKDTPESFLVVSIALEYQIKDELLATELKNKDILIKDKILTYFSQKTKAELQMIENREKFKSEIKKIINTLLKEGRVTNVLFPQYVIQ